MQTLTNIAITYIVGGILFGIALFRARILARWAAALLAVGAVATIATSQLPELTQRLFAIPTGVALIGLGYSLWRDQRTQADAPRPAPSAPSSTRPAQDDHPPRLQRPTRSTGRDRVGAVRAGRPRPAPRHLRLAAPGRAGRRSGT